MMTTALMAAAVLGAVHPPLAPMDAPGSAPAPRQVILAHCGAAAPNAGVAFSGPVLQVIDGHTFCVASGPAPEQWLLVRLPGRAPDADRGALMAASFAKTVDCTVRRLWGDGVVADCDLDGVALDAVARTDPMRAQGRQWR